MKYAFNGMDNGVISISAYSEDKHVLLVIQDNGIGMPEFIDFKNSTGFGMQLVSILTEQIDGNIKIERGEGTKIILKFVIQGD